MGKKGPTPSWRGLPRSIFYFSFFFHHDSASAIGVAAQATFPFGVWSSITRWSFCTVSGGRPSHVSLAVSFRFFEWRKSVSDFSISHILFLLIRNTFVIAVKPIIQVMPVVTLWLLVGFFPLLFHLNFSFLTQPFVDRIIPVFSKIFLCNAPVIWFPLSPNDVTSSFFPSFCVFLPLLRCLFQLQRWRVFPSSFLLSSASSLSVIDLAIIFETPPNVAQLLELIPPFSATDLLCSLLLPFPLF